MQTVIRKLADPEIRRLYTEESKILVPALKRDLSSTKDVNHAWNLVKKWIRRAAQSSCGRFCYNGFRLTSTDTEEIRAAKSRLREASIRMAEGSEEASSDFHSAGVAYRNTIQELEHANRQKMTNDLSASQNAASLLKIISNRKRQRSRAHCRLRVTEMQAHVQHFRSTFGRPHPTSSFRDEENTGIDPTSVETVGDVSISGVSSVGIPLPGATLYA